MAVHPAYDEQFDGFAPAAVRGNRAGAAGMGGAAIAAGRARQPAISASMRTPRFPARCCGTRCTPGRSVRRAWWKTGFRELAARWLPILDAFDDAGVDLCYEIHPGEDLHDGVTFERFLAATGNHPRCHILYDPSHFMLQQLDYLQFIDFYHERIKMFHVKDAEFNPDGRSGVYGGYQGWTDRAGRFRSPGDGQIDFSGIFSQFARYGYAGWAVLEWECCLKHPEDGAREGVDFINQHIIRTTDRAFDDFAGGGADEASNRRILGLDECTQPSAANINNNDKERAP